MIKNRVFLYLGITESSEGLGDPFSLFFTSTPEKMVKHVLRYVPSFGLEVEFLRTVFTFEITRSEASKQLQALVGIRKPKNTKIPRLGP